MKQRRCKACKQPFTPSRPLQTVCSPLCAHAIVQINKAKVIRREVKDGRERLKTRAQWMREAQQAVNAYVRARDAALPCISCGRHHDGQWHAGHYLSTGARPELRFDLDNIHKQCAPCNTHLSGNLVLYRAALIVKVGMATVERLEGPQAPKHYSIDDLKAIRDKYRAMIKELKA